MGITGLLPFLEKSSKKTNIREFSGGTVAIDSYCWLHKGVFSCAEKLMMGQTTDAYVLYCMKYINMLLKYKIKPILVFDGQRLPAKEQTEIKRRESRNMNRRKAMELMQMGQVNEGRNLLRRAIDITHEIALELIKHCQKENVDCIVAPYEADAQLAYLNIVGIADVVITEDSDLTLFGCKKIFFKMDFNGNGVLIEQDRLHLALNMRPDQFDMEKFRHICILSGCDYLPSLPGIGLGKARKFIERNTDRNIHKALTRIGSVLNIKSLVATAEYRDAFVLAEITFKHQLVFCPLQRKQVRLSPPTADITEDQLRYAGVELNADIAFQMALGNCDPSTLKLVYDFNPDTIERKRKRNADTEQTSINKISIWSSKYKLKPENKISKGTLNWSIKAGKDSCAQKKDNVPLRHINSTVQYNSRSSEYEDFNENAVLDMYSSDQDRKLIISPEKRRTEEYLHLTESVSPELFKERNPFVRKVTDHTTSPSVLSSENCRKKGKNLMRIKRTIIDENVIVESKYFSRHNEQRDVLKSEGNIDNFNLKNRVNTPMDADARDADAQREKELQDLKISPVENANLMSKDVDDISRSDPTERWTTGSENVCEKTYPSNGTSELSPVRHFTINDTINDTINNSPVSNDLLVSSSETDVVRALVNCENTSSVGDNSSKWSNTKSPSMQKRKFKRRNSTSLISCAKSVIENKQLRRSKALTSIPRQQSLLSMYGFQKRSSLKH